jgi:hypothetical protein
MCFSPEVSFTAAAVLVPAGGYAMAQASRTAATSHFARFRSCSGCNSFSTAWSGSAVPRTHNRRGCGRPPICSSPWLGWPVWVPFSVYWLEPPRRQPFYLVAAITGAILGAGQFLPYLAHGYWVETSFLPRAIVYAGTEMVRLIIGEIPTYSIYLTLVIIPSLLASDRRGEDIRIADRPRLRGHLAVLPPRLHIGILLLGSRDDVLSRVDDP